MVWRILSINFPYKSGRFNVCGQILCQRLEIIGYLSTFLGQFTTEIISLFSNIYRWTLDQWCPMVIKALSLQQFLNENCQLHVKYHPHQLHKLDIKKWNINLKHFYFHWKVPAAVHDLGLKHQNTSIKNKTHWAIGFQLEQWTFIS